MNKYLFLQFKRILKFFPFVLVVTLVLFLGLALVFGGIMSKNSDREENKVFNIALTGDLDNKYLTQMLSAFKKIDDTRFSMQFVEMDEQSAHKALKKGEISAYIVLPENFVEKAIYGDVEALRYVTTSGNNDIVTLFKNEITKLITDMAVDSQKGTYGLGEALEDNKYKGSVNRHINLLSIEYVDLVFSRSDMIKVEELGISSGLSFSQYYICGIFLCFIMLMGIPFTVFYIRKDNSLQKILLSKGCSNFSQIICEAITFFMALLVLTVLVFAALLVGGLFIKNIDSEIFSLKVLASFVLHSLPVLFLITAFNLLIFEISSNVVSGVLIHFFLTLSLCFVSGCFYPKHTLPVAMQAVSAFTPTGVALSQLFSFFTLEGAWLGSIYTVLYGIVFIGITLIIRSFKITNRGGRLGAKTA